MKYIFLVIAAILSFNFTMPLSSDDDGFSLSEFQDHVFVDHEMNDYLASVTVTFDKDRPIPNVFAKEIYYSNSNNQTGKEAATQFVELDPFFSHYDNSGGTMPDVNQNNKDPIASTLMPSDLNRL